MVSVINMVIDESDNMQLLISFQIKEFKEAIFSIQPHKSLEPDSFNPSFYHQFWNVYILDIFQKCCLWLNNGQFLPSLNSTNIVLIPKGQEQKTMKD